MKKRRMLGGLTAVQFLSKYWQKRPLLIRDAFADFVPVLSREELLALARNEDVESRLITHFNGKWKLAHGPLLRLPSLKKAGWTALVQGVNLHHAEADALMRQFDFLPQARLDDLMISFATDGGGVGPHFDSYDVFLLQAAGQRRWRIGAQKDLTLREDMPLKILREFQPEQEFILEPGDMLYLPPHFAHDGIAVGECMTYSIGFRAPSFQELGEAFMQFMAETIELPGRYADPGLKAARRPAQIDRAMLNTIAGNLKKIRVRADDVSVFLGEYLSEPKPNVYFRAPSALDFDRFLTQAKKRGIRLSLKTQMLYQGKHVFINGESFSASPGDRRILQRLADRRELSAQELAASSVDVLEALHQWQQSGWLALI